MSGRIPAGGHELDTITAAAADEIIIYDASDSFKPRKQTISNILQVSPTGDVVDVTDSTVTLTAASHAGRIVTLSRAAGVTVTLPAATGTGDKYTIITATAVTSNNNIIQVASASDSYTGEALGADDDAEGATGYTWNAETNDDTITMSGTATGGKAGDIWEIIDYASGVFRVSGRLTQSGGSEATPFSAAVS